MILLTIFKSDTAGLRHDWLKVFDGTQPGACAHHEQAAVPQIFTGIDVSLSRNRIWFFNETSNRVCTIHLSAALNVAVTCLWTVRNNTEGHHGAFGSMRQCLLNGLLKCRNVIDHMIRRHDQQNWISAVTVRQ